MGKKRKWSVVHKTIAQKVKLYLIDLEIPYGSLKYMTTFVNMTSKQYIYIHTDKVVIKNGV